MLAWKILGAGLNALAVAAISDTASGLTATGTTQGTAYAMTAVNNEFTTVAANSGAILYAGTAGDSQFVYNGGANPLRVYPPSGSQINSLGANFGALVPPATGCLFKCMSTTRWAGVLSR